MRVSGAKYLIFI